MALAPRMTFDFIDRPRTQIVYKRGGLLQCLVSVDSVAITPTTPLITVERPGGAAVTTPVGTINSDGTVTGTSTGVSLSGNTMQYTLSAGNSDLLVGQFGAYAPWIAIWTFTYNGTVYDAQETFDVVRYPLTPVVTVSDLKTLHPDQADSLYTTETTAQNYIDIAWSGIYEKMINLGIRPYIIVDNESLRWPHAHLTLHYYFKARTKDGDKDRWEKLSAWHRKEFDTWFQTTKFNYDLAQAGSLIPGNVNRPLTQVFTRT